MEERLLIAKFWFGNINGIAHIPVLDVNGRISEWISKKKQVWRWGPD
jgi:hypothetical protein